jgi:hypothetical protein
MSVKVSFDRKRHRSRRFSNEIARFEDEPNPTVRRAADEPQGRER